MEVLTKLIDAKNIAIGECFVFGKYADEPIMWLKIDKHLAISNKILDCVVFDSYLNNEYNTSLLRYWCNNVLGKQLSVEEDTIFILDKERLMHYYPEEEDRQTLPTEWAILHGVFPNDIGCADYWTSSSESEYSFSVCAVDSYGLFYDISPHTFSNGVRPAIKL